MGALLQINYDADILGGFVTHALDTLNLLLMVELSNLLDQVLLVHTVRDLGDHDLRLATLTLSNVGHTASDDWSTTRSVSVVDILLIENDSTSWEVWTLNKFQKILSSSIRIIDKHDRSIHHLIEIVRWDVGGHTHRNTKSTVEEEVGSASWQNDWLLLSTIVVGAEVDCLLVDILEHLARELAHLGLGITHSGSIVTVDGAEVALPDHHWVTHGEVLGQADHGVVYRHIAVWVVLTKHLTHHCSRLAGLG